MAEKTDFKTELLINRHKTLRNQVQILDVI